MGQVGTGGAQFMAKLQFWGEIAAERSEQLSKERHRFLFFTIAKKDSDR